MIQLEVFAANTPGRKPIFFVTRSLLSSSLETITIRNFVASHPQISLLVVTGNSFHCSHSVIAGPCTLVIWKQLPNTHTTQRAAQRHCHHQNRFRIRARNPWRGLPTFSLRTYILQIHLVISFPPLQ